MAARERLAVASPSATKTGVCRRTSADEPYPDTKSHETPAGAQAA